MSVVGLLSQLRSLDVTLREEAGRLHIDAPRGALTGELRDELVRRKEDVLVFLRQATTITATPRPRIEPAQRDGEAPLSFAQQRLWFLDRLAPGNPFYISLLAWTLRGPFDARVLERALGEVVRRHEALRTRFPSRQGRPVQAISPPAAFRLPLVDLDALAADDRRTEERRLASEEARRPFDLARGPVLRAALLWHAADGRDPDDGSILLLTLHHIVSDGWSVGVLNREILTLYGAFAAGEPSPLPELEVQYADFAIWQRRWLRGEVLEAQLAYWQERLAGAEELRFATDRPRPAVQSFRGRHQAFALPAALSEALDALSREHQTALFMTLLAGFQALVHRLTQQDDVVIGSPIANRHHEQVEGLVGFFVNSLAMRCDLGGDPRFGELLARVKEMTLGAYAHQDLPFEQLVEHLGTDRDLSRNPLFQWMFVLHNAPRPAIEAGGLSMERRGFDVRSTRFDLEVHLSESPDGLTGSLFYDVALFDRTTIQRLHRHFRTLLESVVEDPALRLSQLRLLRPAEVQQLREWNDVAAPYPRRSGLGELFARQVSQRPDAVALAFAEECWTYGRLDRSSSRLARRLRRLGCGPGVLVGLCAGRSPQMVVATLAIVKCGAAYVPLDPSYPGSRLAFMIEDAAMPVLLVERRFEASLPEALAGRAVRVVVLEEVPPEGGKRNVLAGCDDPSAEARPPASSAGGDDLAYVIYTSGSTGRPKGVAVPQRAVSRLVLGTDYVQLRPSDRVAQASSTSFDAATFEIWGALLGGACLVGVPRDLALSPPELARELRRRAISTLFLTTALFNQLERGAPGIFGGLRHLLFGGEAVDPKWVREVLRRDGSGHRPPRRLLHVYGPTESTTFATWQKVSGVPVGASTVPIGRPLANTTAEVLDRYGVPVPVGIPGELFIGGEGLARAYLGRPALTAERFCPGPLGRRRYRTGDLVRRGRGGEIEFLGRVDHQVKLRGFRIELGEIETVLEEHPAIRDAVVVIRREAGEVSEGRRLVAYVVQEPDYRGERAATEPAEDVPGDRPENRHAGNRGELVSRWQLVFDDIYGRGAPTEEDRGKPSPTFNTIGWNSSYTGEPLPAEDMAEWVEDTVGRILAERPRRVWEIGCGTGLLLFRIAPATRRYLGTDVSGRALADLGAALGALSPGLPQVTLEQRAADDFAGIEPASFDAVVLNSVVQYFPDVGYLVKVIEGAVSALAPGGVVFLGDLRSLPLLETFHASVELDKADAAWPLSQVWQRARAAALQEDELVLDPRFFDALMHHLPNLRRVEIVPKRGRRHNELTRFRYQALLHVDQDPSGAALPGTPRAPSGTTSPDPTWLDWRRQGLSLDRLRRRLEQQAPEVLALSGVPNARLATLVWARQALASGDGQQTVAELRRDLRRTPAEPGVDPQALWALAEELPYEVELGWHGHGEDGGFDAVLRRRDAAGPAAGVTDRDRRGDPRPRPWSAYANDPQRARFASEVTPELRAFLERRLPEYMVPATYVLLASLPLNANGKIDRAALPEPEPSRILPESDFVAPRNREEEILAKIWGRVLGLEPIGVEDDFFALGGHSLLATQVISQIRRAFDLELPLRALFEEPTIAGLALRVRSAGDPGDGRPADEDRRLPPIELLARRHGIPAAGSVPLSFAQQRLWFLDRLTPGNPFYNTPVNWLFRGPLRRAELEHSLRQILRRHEVLRTHFPSEDGRPRQVVRASVAFALPVVELDSLAGDDRRAELDRLLAGEASRPFDLAEGPVFRALLVRLRAQQAALLLTLHHIASDGWSLGILRRELAALYEARVRDAGDGKSAPLPELPVQYADFAVWQRRWLRGAALERQVAYWRRQLAGVPPLELPLDRPRPVVQSFRGRYDSLRLDRRLSAALGELSQERGATPFMTLLAAFEVLLYRHTGQERFAVGTPIANRRASELEGLIGFFVNSLTLTARPRGSSTFLELLEQVKEVALGAYAHQDLPFEKLVEALDPERDLSRNPFFQVMFAFQNAPAPPLAIADLKAEPLASGVSTPRFDLEVHMWEAGGRLTAGFLYSDDLFDRTTMARLARHFETLLQGIAAAVRAEGPGLCLDNLPLLAPAEARQLLAEWNDTADASPAPGVEALFAARAARCPDAIAVEHGDRYLSYRQLARLSGRVARRLARPRGLQTADLVVGLCAEPSPEALAAVLGVLEAGGAYLPLDPSYPRDRLDFMLADSGASRVLTGRRTALPPRARTIALEKVVLEPAAGLGGGRSKAGERSEAAADAQDLAYVIYTSGSTGRPKGVAMRRGALANLIAWQLAQPGFERGRRTLQFASLSFDVSFQEIFSTWCSGGTLVLLDAGERRDPAALLASLARLAVERLFVPFVALQQLAEHAREGPLPAALRRVVTAGEQLQVSAAVARFFERLPRATLDNHYGPTEAHVVTAFPLAGSPAAWPTLPPIGRPIRNAGIFLLGHHPQPVPPGSAGELAIGGDCLARGYLRRPGLTAERFVPHPHAGRVRPGSRLYRTGDLARATSDGRFEFLGRTDQQLKVRGFRVEPGEIEAVLAGRPRVREAAVVARPDRTGAQQLVAYLVIDDAAAQAARPWPGSLRQDLRRQLPEHMVPAFFVRLAELPLTPSGKVDRRALLATAPEAPELEGFVAPRTPLEEVMADLWAAVLDVDRVGADDNFFDLGGHSLLATRLISRVRQTFGLEVPLRMLFEAPSVAGLTRRLETAAGRRSAPPIVRRPRSARVGEPPLSFAQERLWFLDRIAPGNAFYNFPLARTLRGDLDAGALERALKELVVRHEALRTRFPARHGQPVQVVSPPPDMALPVVDLRGLEGRRGAAEARRLAGEEAERAFDLARGPVLRAVLVLLGDAPSGEGEAAFLLTLHHIVADGWSVGLLLRELMALYGQIRTGRPPSLPELPIQYADFALWQRRWLRGPVLEEQLAYWRRQLASAPVLELPTDRPRPAVPSFRGRRLVFALPGDTADGLETLSRQLGATLFMTLLGAFEALLARVTGQLDLVIGSPIANRQRIELEGLIGFFVNTLALRTDLTALAGGGDPPFGRLAARVKEVVLGAYVHQDLPFEKLVAELEPDRDLSRNPLFQVAFMLHHAPRAARRVAGLAIDSLAFEAHTTRVDLEVHVWQGPAGLSVVLFYDLELFDDTTIRRLQRHFETLLAGLVGERGAELRLSQLPVLRAAEAHQLLVEWNATDSPQCVAREPPDRCIHELFEAQAARRGDALALVAGDHRLTYRQLDRLGDRLARRLRALRVGPETVVALAMDRCVELVWGILGVVKAGGVYLPLDVSSPEPRLAAMLEDAAPRVLLTLDRPAAALAAGGWETLALSRLAGAGGGSAGAGGETIRLNRRDGSRRLAVSLAPDHLAYMIYTSGSTGRPKRVAVAHRGLVNLVRWYRRFFGPGEGVTQVAPASFDHAVWEIWNCLASGATLHLVDDDVRLSPPAMWRFLASQQVHFCSLPAPLAEALLREAPPPAMRGGGLRAMMIGGERLHRGALRPLPFDVFNCYGPSEVTVHATTSKVMLATGLEASALGDPPIGRPMDNVRVHLLDRHLRPVPVGVTGELYVAGLGLARGYDRRPERTAERFIPDPFAGRSPPAAAGGAGGRLYRTGDRARYLPDGELEFLERVDHQVKVRGFRVELGEIESTLGEHPAVLQSAVVARPGENGDTRLVAYVAGRVEDGDELAAARAEHVDQWQTLYDQSYARAASPADELPADESPDPELDIVGWNSSYTGEPIATEEMREWVEATVERLLELRPRRVLEIGCGTGLLLWRVAPRCRRYLGTDFSPAVLARLEDHLASRDLPQVELRRQLADDFSGLQTETFDTVILNSVVQYFPSVDYLVRVVEQALEVLSEGGVLFLGDLRSLPLQTLFCLSVQLHKASDSLPVSELSERIRRQRMNEEELLIDPALFAVLRRRLPAIGAVRILPRRGRHHNELTRFRYDAILRVGGDGADREAGDDLEWLDWRREGLDLSALRHRLEHEGPDVLALAAVPNARLATETAALDLLAGADAPTTVGELRRRLRPADGEALDPDVLCSWSAELPYRVGLGWGRSEAGAELDVVFRRDHGADSGTGEVAGDSPPADSFLTQVDPERPLASYGNDPLQGKLAARLVPDLRRFLGDRLPEAMVPAAFVVMESLPLTSHGKVDRRALPEVAPLRPELEETFVAPRTAVETAVARIWSAVLGVERIGIDDDFFELGGHSLLATQVVSRLRDVSGVELPLVDFFQTPTVRGLATAVEGHGGDPTALGVERAAPEDVPHPTAAAGDAEPLLEPIARRPAARHGERELPLSFAQQRMWFLDRLTPGNASYHMFVAWRVRGTLDPSRLERALLAMVRRHESLRTRFPSRQGRPVQVVNPRATLPLMRIDLRGLRRGQRRSTLRPLLRSEIARPFDLAAGPVIRTTLVHLAPRRAALLVTLHHIVADGWSLGVLQRELAALYGADEVLPRRGNLPELEVQYADFAVWQRRWLSGEVLDRQLAFWRRQLAGAPVVDLPTDRPRPAAQTFRGRRQTLLYPAALADALSALGQRHGATLFMTLLAAFQTLLHRLTGQDDVVVGSPIAGRNRSQIEGLIGLFVNSLALRCRLSGDPPFVEVLEQVRERALGAYGHQDLPFEMLVEALQPERDLSRNPVFQIMFALQNAPIEALDLANLEVEQLPLEVTTTRFDLDVHLWQVPHGLAGAFSYDLDLFDNATIRRWQGHFRGLLEAVVEDPRRRVSELTLLAASQEQQILAEWNATVDGPPWRGGVHDLFAAQAARTPEAVAVLGGLESLTYRQLDRSANRIARHLIQRSDPGRAAQSLVGVCMGRSPRMLAAILGVLKAGGAYVPLDPEYPRDRLAFMLADSAAPLVITEAGLADRFAGAQVQALCLDREWRRIRRQPPSAPASRAAPGDLIYVMYTSGSTGRPKGVAIEHRGPAALIHWSLDAFAGPELAGLLASTSICFDLSVFELFLPLAAGTTVILAENALELPSLPARDRVTLLNTVPSVAGELLRLGDLPHSVRTVTLCGEPLSGALARRIHRQPAVRRLINFYGPTEDTTYSTVAWVTPAEDAEPAIGRPLTATRSYVLDRRSRPVPAGIPGLLHLAGAGLARGYLGRPRQTAERFLPDELSRVPGGRLYDTGDLVRLQPAGELEFLGRVDHQVKVRGFRVELGEIEAVLDEHPSLRQTVVVVRPDAAGGSRLVACCVPRDGETVSAGGLRSLLGARLPDYMVPSTFLSFDRLPQTPNGKVDRAALGRAVLDQAVLDRAGSGRAGSERGLDDGPAAPRGPVAEAIADIWRQVLEVERVGAHDDFFELGGHSLLATQVLARMTEVLGLELPLKLFFERPTVAALAETATHRQLATEHGGLASRRPIPRLRRSRGPFPLSYAQLRQWILDRLEPGTSAYTIPLLMALDGHLDAPALAGALNEIVRRHAALRTTFTDRTGDPQQLISPAVGVALPIVDLSGLAADRRRSQAERQAIAAAAPAMDLTRGPLLRACLIRLANDRHWLSVTMHHIVSDGWSIMIFWRELATLYRAASGVAAGEGVRSPLRELPIRYVDFAAWQNRRLRGETLGALVDFWRRQLAAGPGILELPLDRPRPAVRTTAGAIHTLRLPSTLVEELRAVAAAESSSLFMVLLSGLKALLARYCAQTDVSVGTFIANRNRGETADLIGFFVNTLVLRTDLSGNPSPRRLLRRVREVALAAYAHQDLPFEKLLDSLQVERDPSHTPLFQVLVVLQNLRKSTAEASDVRLAHLPLKKPRVDFDLELWLYEGGDRIRGELKYNRDLFDRSTINRLAGHFQAALGDLATQPDERLSTLSLLAPAERQQVLVEWNESRTPLAAPAVHELFERQVERTPDRVAVVFGRESVSYRGLAARAGRLARRLRQLGVGAEVVVGLAIERCPDMVAAMLGVLSAGGAYLPLDPDYPPERLTFLLRDAGVPLVLTRGGTAATLREPAAAAGASVLELDGALDERSPKAPQVPWTGATDRHRPGRLAYMIYTSGSTGRPKGVQIDVQALTSFTHSACQVYGLRASDRILQFAALSFDASVEEIYPPLILGATVVLRQGSQVLSPQELMSHAGDQRLTVLPLPTAYWHELSSVEALALPASLRLVIFGGEQVADRAVRDWRRRAPAVRLINGYGPTEATVTATACDLAGRRSAFVPGRRAPIGRPLGGVRALVLDAGLSATPAGIRGELCIGGAALARGYLGRPALTAEKFVADPFSERPGTRLYRTGDLARWRGDGHLEFLGRLDDQVKLRGLRIEPGEVAAILGRHRAVKEAEVIFRAGVAGAATLVAYVVPRRDIAPAGELDVADLRGFLRQQIPEFMVPSAFDVLDDLPVTRSGKIDRKALARRALPALGEKAGSRAEPVAPTGDLQRTVHAAWCRVLKLDGSAARHLGVDANFFDVGGDSLLILRLHRELLSELGTQTSGAGACSLKVLDLFHHATVRAQAAHLEAGRPRSGRPRPGIQRVQDLAAERRRARGRRRPPRKR